MRGMPEIPVYVSKNVFLEINTSGESIHLDIKSKCFLITTEKEKHHISGKLYF